MQRLIKIDDITPEVLPTLVSGVSASLALTHAGEMSTNEKILIASAADGTGLFAAQLAKIAGNYVIAVCSSGEVASKFSAIGCDRVLISSTEPVAYMLRMEYSSGIDLALDLTGGIMLRTCVENLAPHGRVVAIEAVSQLHELREGEGANPEREKWGVEELTSLLISRSASLRGFSLLRCEEALVRSHVLQLLELVKDNSIQSTVDPIEFVGLEAIPDAVDRLVSSENAGKLVVRLVR